jgi:hypothetical protein
LPFYFRHQKFESFVRQLNLYGFKKLKSPERQRFTHHLLQSGSKYILGHSDSPKSPPARTPSLMLITLIARAIF